MCINANVNLDGDEDEDDIVSNANADFGMYAPDNATSGPISEPGGSGGARRRNRDLIAAERIRDRIVRNYF